MAHNSFRSQVAANREAARRSSGQFGEQLRSAPDEGLLNLATSADEYGTEGNGLFLHFTKPLLELTPDEVHAQALTLDDEDLNECIAEAESASDMEWDRHRQAEKDSWRRGETEEHAEIMRDSKENRTLISGTLEALNAERVRRDRIASEITDEHAATLDADPEFRAATGERMDARFTTKLPQEGELSWEAAALAAFGEPGRPRDEAQDARYSIQHTVLCGSAHVGRIRGPLRALLPEGSRTQLEEMVVRKHFGSYTEMQQACRQYNRETADRIVAMLEDAHQFTAAMEAKGLNRRT